MPESPGLSRAWREVWNLEWLRTHRCDRPMRMKPARLVQKHVHELIKRRRVGDGFRRVWAAESEMVKDLVDHGPVCNERDDAHGTAAFGTDKRVFAPDLANELGPSFSALFTVGSIRFMLRGW